MAVANETTGDLSDYSRYKGFIVSSLRGKPLLFWFFFAVNIKTLNDRYCKVITCANEVAK